MAIELLLSPNEVHAALTPHRRAHASVGLVPTMGALHRGHASLIEQCAEQNDVTVVSIFVNPIQFDDPGDFDTYPSTLEADMKVCEEAGADYVFVPSAAEMYPPGFSSFVDMSGASEVLCGRSRQGHFRGVLTVVNKLLNIVQPAAAYFGEKDAQQLFVIRKMVRELNMPIAVVGCRTVRDRDLLALSSRNGRLSEAEREAAGCLVRALMKACTALSYADAGVLVGDGATGGDARCNDDAVGAAGVAVGSGDAVGAAGAADGGVRDIDTNALRAGMVQLIESEPLARLDYAEVLDGDTFLPPDADTNNVLFAAAAWFGETRLIDNMTYKRNGHAYGCPCCT